MSARLGELLHELADAGTAGDRLIEGLSLDSRAIAPGMAFIALRGTRQHGVNFAADAAARGAAVVLAEGPVVASPDLNVPLLWIENLSARLGDIAARFYGHPAQRLTVIGVTGTNGKTSTVQLLAQALDALGFASASIGTLGAGRYGQLAAGERTTPDAIHTQALLADFVAQGVTHVAMEVSSHALVQGRVGGVRFHTAAFTNLTRDHLDYHGTMQAYGEAKARLFAWPGLSAAVINSDDAFGLALAERVPAAVTTLRLSCAVDQGADLFASDIVTSDEGLSFHLRTPWGARTVHSALLGQFNVANLLAVAGCLGALDVDFERLVAVLAQLMPVRGRMSRLAHQAGQPLVVVDYAHTPDALQQALTALRAHCAGRLICVFGCGGERDPGKRPLMGATAERLADAVIVTDDNPRGEDGDAIVAQITAGLSRPAAAQIERDRSAAIAHALAEAGAGDVVLIAGKGHETYQETASGRREFDDLAVARAAMEAHA